MRDGTRRSAALRLVFWAAALFTLVMALLPHPPELPGEPSDKVQHIAAFATLSALASFAYPRSALWIGAGLCLFGAAIELLQAIPVLHRDSSALDWLADTAAILVVLGAIRLWRARSLSQS